MALETKILAKALRKYYAAHGRGTWSKLQKKSGVHNLGRIANEEIEPSIESWEKLHKSFPEFLPPPQVSGDTPVSDQSIMDFWHFSLALLKKGGEGGIAQKAGITKKEFDKIINRKTIPSKSTQDAIAHACGYSYQEFIEIGIIENDRLRESMFSEKNTGTNNICDLNNPYKVKHYELINLFPDQEKGLELNSVAVELARLEPADIDKVIDFINDRIAYQKVIKGISSPSAGEKGDNKKTASGE